MAELLVLVDCRHIEIDRRQCVEIDRRSAGVAAKRGDRLNREAVGESKLTVGSGTLRNDFLLGVVQAATRVELVVEHRRAGEQPRNQAVATARVAFVTGVVGAETEHRVVVTADFNGNAAG